MPFQEFRSIVQQRVKQTRVFTNESIHEAFQTIEALIDMLSRLSNSLEKDYKTWAFIRDGLESMSYASTMARNSGTRFVDVETCKETGRINDLSRQIGKGIYIGHTWRDRVRAKNEMYDLLRDLRKAKGTARRAARFERIHNSYNSRYEKMATEGGTERSSNSASPTYSWAVSSTCSKWYTKSLQSKIELEKAVECLTERYTNIVAEVLRIIMAPLIQEGIPRTEDYIGDKEQRDLTG